MDKLQKIKNIIKKYKATNSQLIDALSELIIDNETISRKIEIQQCTLTGLEFEKEINSSCTILAQKELNNNEIMLEKCNKLLII